MGETQNQAYDYDVWWDWVHNLRISAEDLMREFFWAKADFEIAKKRVEWYKGRKRVIKEYEKARKKMLDLINIALGLMNSIDKAIDTGKTIPEDKRRENYDHLMMRLQQARESVSKIIDYARQNGLIENLKDGIKQG